MTVETHLAKTTDRKEWYRLQIEHYIRNIPLMQAADGSFREHIEPEYKPGENARLQEGILPLAWHMHRFGTQNFSKSIVAGLRYLLKMQLDNGAYPETEGESFAATAFAMYALGKTLEYTHTFLPGDLKNNIQSAIQNSLIYLMSEKNIPYTNQLAAALLAIKQGSEISPISDSLLREKLAIILSQRDSSGLFKEGDGLDLGYSTLTYSLLSTFDNSQDYYKEFINTLQFLLFPDGTHILPMSRTHGWIILNALEAASRYYPNAEELAERHILAHEKGLCDATHIISNRHILTTLYRLCEAHDNCQKRSSPLDLKEISYESRIPSKYLQCFYTGKLIALLYLSKNFLGYSFYLGANRILFGSSQNSVLIRKKRKRMLIKSSQKFLRRKTLRGFKVSDNSLLLDNIFTDEPIFSIGPLLSNGYREFAYWEANQNMFYRGNLFRAQLTRFKSYIFHYKEK